MGRGASGISKCQGWEPSLSCTEVRNKAGEAKGLALDHTATQEEPRSPDESPGIFPSGEITSRREQLLT